MDFKPPREAYAGFVREVTIGKGERAIKVGGQNILPLHFFDDGTCPNPQRFALEVLDMRPYDWPDFLVEPFKDVLDDPGLWAKRCQELGADMVCLYLLSTDPAEKDAGVEVALETVHKVLATTRLPLIIYGSGDEKKDELVLSKIASSFPNENFLIGPVQKENYETLGKAILENGHLAIAQTPLDINLLKELNVKLCKFMPVERIVIDPLSSPLGYGMEYSFSLMERVKQIGIITQDPMTQMPIIANIASECYKTKQAKEDKVQGLLWEGITALSLLLAGADILVLRHPETMKAIREVIGR